MASNRVRPSYNDSQESDLQDPEVMADPELQDSPADLFDEQQAQSAESNTLQKILVELRALRNTVEKVVTRLDSLEKSQQTTFSIKQSGIEAPFQSYLKNCFSKYPWLNEEDVEFRMTITRLLRNANVNNACAARKCISYALSQYTNWRNQIRIKLVGHNGKKVPQGMSLRELNRYLFYGHVNVLEDLFDESRMRRTILMRAFVHNNKLFHGQGGKDADFWKTFKEFNDSVQHDPTTDKWRMLEEREERRIRKFNDLLNIEI